MKKGIMSVLFFCIVVSQTQALLGARYERVLTHDDSETDEQTPLLTLTQEDYLVSGLFHLRKGFHDCGKTWQGKTFCVLLPVLSISLLFLSGFMGADISSENIVKECAKTISDICVGKLNCSDVI